MSRGSRAYAWNSRLSRPTSMRPSDWRCGCARGKAGIACPANVDGCGYAQQAIHGLHQASTRHPRSYPRAVWTPHRSSTTVHDISTIVPHNVDDGDTTGSERPAHYIHQVSTSYPGCPHYYPQIVEAWEWAPVTRHNRLLMHTRG